MTKLKPLSVPFNFSLLPQDIVASIDGDRVNVLSISPPNNDGIRYVFLRNGKEPGEWGSFIRVNESGESTHRPDHAYLIADPREVTPVDDIGVDQWLVLPDDSVMEVGEMYVRRGDRRGRIPDDEIGEYDASSICRVDSIAGSRFTYACYTRSGDWITDNNGRGPHGGINRNLTPNDFDLVRRAEYSDLHRSMPIRDMSPRLQRAAREAGRTV